MAGLLAAVVALAVIGLAVGLLTRNSPTTAGPAAIAAVDTQDVHSLAFLGRPERILLGHHGGILESTDAGRTWTAWGTGADAMAMGAADDDPVIVAGHNVLAVGRPDGHWENIANDLPNTDIHGLARDPNDPNHVWAYLAAGGVYESRDGGSHWVQVFDGHALALFAASRDGPTRLVAVDPERRAIVSSDDGGQNWQAVGTPPTTPVYAMAGANGSSTILMSGSEGLFRSDDAGQTFTPLVDVGQPILAIAATEDGKTIIFASRDRSIYRSDDGGRTWPAN